MNIKELIKENAKLADNYIASALPVKDDDFSVIFDAVRYSAESGGKRIRPMLTLEFCRMCGGRDEDALLLAAALELIHTYSLIHDDLPCMDDDDFRRGKPTNHKVFGEDVATLAGDALLTLAFETVLSAEGVSDCAKAKAGLELAKAAGCSGMIAGQVMDLANEGRKAGLDEIAKTDRLKTGELIMAAASMGCIAADADAEKTAAAREYCADIGLAFQIQDDILDVWGNPETFGKAVGGDISCNKKTFVALTAMQLADAATRQKLCQWFKQTLTDNTEKIAAVKALYEQAGTRTACEKAVEQYTTQALHLLSLLPQNQATEQLRQLANKLNARKN